MCQLQGQTCLRVGVILIVVYGDQYKAVIVYDDQSHSVDTCLVGSTNPRVVPYGLYSGRGQGLGNSPKSCYVAVADTPVVSCQYDVAVGQYGWALLRIPIWYPGP